MKNPAVGSYFLRKPAFSIFGPTHGWTLERSTGAATSYMIATFDGGVAVGEVERIIANLNAAPKLLELANQIWLESQDPNGADIPQDIVAVAKEVR